MALKNPIKYAYFVESVSRKFTLRKNKCSQNNSYGNFTAEPARFMGGAVRHNTRFGYGAEQKNYMFLRFNPRTTPVTGDERTLRNYFALASKLANKWRKDLTTIGTIMQAWEDPSNGSAQGVHKSGYTFRGWLFAVGYAVAANGGSEASAWPTYSPA